MGFNFLGGGQRILFMAFLFKIVMTVLRQEPQKKEKKSLVTYELHSLASDMLTAPVLVVHELYL